MNKLTKGLLTVSLATLIAGAVGCNGGVDAWKGTTFTNYGAVIANTNGGFVAETDNYVYFINGLGASSSDNTFGKPIKGALVAADKNDLNNSQVVIPELMVSSDYDAGVYLFEESDGVYAYYGTPNREKNSSGDIAYSEMCFTKTRLDGKNSKKLFTVSSHSTTYRIAQLGQGEDKAVYIIYYDVDESAIISYNTKSGEKTVVAKTDAKTNVSTNGEYLSLGEYKFLKNGNSAQVVYTMTVYTQEYFAEQEAQEDSYTRETANYNYMYLCSADGKTVLLKDGKAQGDTTFAVKNNVDNYLFYTETKFGGNAKTYGCMISDAASAVEIGYPDNVKDGMIIKSFGEVYYYDSDAKQVIKNTLVKEPLTEYYVKTPILKDETVSSLLAVEEFEEDKYYIYCFNSDGYIVAIDNAEDGRTVRVSERTASSSWYKPETVKLTVNGVETEYMLYSDSSSEGNSYIHYACIDKPFAAKTEDTDDDGEIDVYYLESSFIGVMPAADRAAAVSSVINAIESPLDLKEEIGDEGKYYVENTNSIQKARAAYDNLDEDAKKLISESDLKRLENAEKAIALANAFIKLETVLDYNNLTDTQKSVLSANYEAAKQLAENYGDDYSAIAGFLTDNLNYFYQETGAKLNASAEEE